MVGEFVHRTVTSYCMTTYCFILVNWKVAGDVQNDNLSDSQYFLYAGSS